MFKILGLMDYRNLVTYFRSTTIKTLRGVARPGRGPVLGYPLGNPGGYPLLFRKNRPEYPFSTEGVSSVPCVRPSSISGGSTGVTIRIDVRTGSVAVILRKNSYSGTDSKNDSGGIVPVNFSKKR